MNGTYGKIKLEAQTFLMPERKEVNALVYIHVKGYARARVTHLNVEKVGLGRVIHREKGNFQLIKGIKCNLEIVLKEKREVEVNGEKRMVSSIIIVTPLLNKVLGEGKSTRTWVGRKYDDIYIGFKRDGVERSN